MSGCDNLKRVFTDGMSSLKEIEGFDECPNVEIVELNGLKSLKRIGEHFLAYGWNENFWVKITIETLESLEQIFCHFMNERLNVDKIIFPPTPNLEQIGFDFMKNCANLRIIVFEGNLEKLQSIYPGFCKGGSRLETLQMNATIDHFEEMQDVMDDIFPPQEDSDLEDYSEQSRGYNLDVNSHKEELIDFAYRFLLPRPEEGEGEGEEAKETEEDAMSDDP
jgi:hypothetical protein